MDNFYSSIDPLKMVGAKLVSANVNGKQMNCILVPVNWNNIEVFKNDDGTFRAHMGLDHWGVNENYRKACLERNAGKADYVAPSHDVSVHYSEKFMEAATKSAEARLRKDATYMATNPTDEEIQKKAKYEVRNRARLGNMTPKTPRQAVQYNGAAPTAGTMGEYKAPDANQPVEPEDDLPF